MATIDDIMPRVQPYDTLLSYTAALTETWIGAQPTGLLTIEQLPNVIRTIYGALRDADGPTTDVAPAVPPVEKPTAKQIRDSITDDALISFEDGKSYKMLRNHLTKRGMSLANYREKWGLPKDYPSVAKSYSEQRSELAKAAGLGRK